MSTHDSLADRFEIRELLDNWIIFKDTGQWDRFRTLWHPEGWMNFLWFRGSVEEFIDFSKKSIKRGAHLIHTVGGTSLEIAGERCIAISRTLSSSRLTVHGVECDLLTFGRYYDFLEKRDNRWGLVMRQPIYERDLLSTVDPTETVRLDNELLKDMPAAVRYRAYAQKLNGYEPNRTVPGLDGGTLDHLNAECRSWLDGKAGGPSF